MRFSVNKLNKTQIWGSSLFYIFTTLYLQQLDLVFGFSITKISIAIFMIYLVLGITTNKIRISVISKIACVIYLIYLSYYLLYDSHSFINIYPLVIVMFVAGVYLDNADSIRKNINFTYLKKLLFPYCFINFILYIFDVQSSFQDNGFQLQFKGALPHSNLFGSIIISLFILIFWEKSMKSIINKTFLTILIFFTLSRTYILLVIALWMIWCITFFGKKFNIWVKAIFGIVIIVLFGIPLFNGLIGSISVLSRFSSGIFSNLNGRNYLHMAYYEAFASSSWEDKITGFGLASRYNDLIALDFLHSFAENSYAATLILMGLVGITLLLVLIYRLFKNTPNIQTILIILLMLTSLFVQDTLLSTQAGILFIFSLIVLKESAP